MEERKTDLRKRNRCNKRKKLLGMNANVRNRSRYMKGKHPKRKQMQERKTDLRKKNRCEKGNQL